MTDEKIYRKPDGTFVLHARKSEDQKEIESLRQRVKELESDLKIERTRKESAHELLTACEKERNSAREKLQKYGNGICEELAASQAREQQLRDNVKKALIGISPFFDIDVALSLPHDTSALDAMRKDAARYRFLEGEAYETVVPHGGKIDGKRTAWIVKLHPGETFDAAIDAAMEGK